jgi:translation initiation factor IF-2
MAKIRVYELARVLNTTNKVLLDKINEMNLPVKSHMSSLDDAAVREIKAHFFGKNGNEYDEKRIRPTIIRRRAKPARKPAATVADDNAPMKNDEQSVAVKPVDAPPAEPSVANVPAADPGVAESADTVSEIEAANAGKQLAEPDLPDPPAVDQQPQPPKSAGDARARPRRPKLSNRPSYQNLPDRKLMKPG